MLTFLGPGVVVGGHGHLFTPILGYHKYFPGVARVVSVCSPRTLTSLL